MIDRHIVMAQSKRVILYVFAILLVGNQVVQAYYNGYNEQHSPPEVHVVGKVVCEYCDDAQTDPSSDDYNNEDQPIAGVIVGITCLDERGRSVYSAHNNTNYNGDFDICLKKLKYDKYGLEGCRVRLLKSPDPKCDVKTNFGAGRSGAYLDESPIYGETVIYRVGPFAFTPNTCSPP